ncbi:MAG: MFS transporter [Planctomycetota bacterium]|nr:MFS transporter [Planctomycetota bacterium]
MSTDLYLRLSAMMFLEYAIWGAWAPVLAARLLGPLKMSGKQTGWIYATLPLACIISPLVAGQLADQYLNSEWILTASHLIGAVLLLVAAKLQDFKGLFITMLLYSLCFGATLPLVNSLMFTALKTAEVDPSQSANIFIWAPISWALIGYCLTGFRMMRKVEGDGSDCLVFAGILSFVMAVVCMIQPETPPTSTGGEMPIVTAFGMLGDESFLIFIVISMAVVGMMQFYFLGTAQFMQDIGISSKKVPASMAVAQAAQAIATLFVLGGCLAMLGFKWTLLGAIGFKGTLLIGAGAWLLMYVFYVFVQKPAVIVISQGLHGLAYVAFIIVGQVYANAVAPDHIKGSIQALTMAATTGLGLFLGTQLAGIVMDHYSVDGKFVWRKLWMVPGGIVLVGMIALTILFSNPVKSENAAEKPAAVETPEAAFVAPIDHVARLG